ncbi:MAG: nicotinate phosphoribosyltransferase [Eubacteriaceae bacterium]|nr:nicotinate phosphoribosyltransferase [Eubacteriaceae bacterium]
MKQRKLSLATDFYQLSVANVYYASGMANDVAVFDMFIRKNPFDGGYTVFAGLEHIISYIQNLSFSEDDIALLKANHPELTDSFLSYLLQFRFSGEIYSVKEGDIVFPHEPLLRVKAPIIQAQIVETAILAIVNHETLIATKAARIVTAAQGGAVIDFGLRRAHGTEAGLYGARAAIIGGCAGTSNVEAEYAYGAVSKGTVSHAFIMSYDEEYDAFRAYAELNPQNITLIADTYDTLRSGVPNAIRLFRELRDEGGLKGAFGIRLDSGDISYLSKKARVMLDEAGFADARITASSDLDEHAIYQLRSDGARVDAWGVGTRLITAWDCPSLGGVYKLAQLTKNGKFIDKMKISDDPFKITNPGYKKILRLFNRNTNKATADLVMANDETLDENEPLRLYHPYFTYKTRVVSGFYTEEILKPAFIDGELACETPPLADIASYHQEQRKKFWSEVLRINNPDEYHVDISDRLYDIKKRFLHNHNYKQQ